MTDHACALHINLNEKSVAIAVGGSRHSLQPIAGCLAFGPKFLAGSAVESHVSRFQRSCPSLGTHEAQHQDFSTAGVLNDCRGKPAHFLEIDLDHCLVLPSSRFPSCTFVPFVVIPFGQTKSPL